MKLDYTKENVYIFPLDMTAKRRRSMRKVNEQANKLNEIIEKNGGLKSEKNPTGITVDDSITIYQNKPIVKPDTTEPDVA